MSRLLLFCLFFCTIFLSNGFAQDNSAIKENVKVIHASGMDTLYVNGNQDDQLVKFPHEAHINWIKSHKTELIKNNVFQSVSNFGKNDCEVCHHLKLPGEKLSACSECHSNMYSQVDFFNHGWHQTSLITNLKCEDCHKAGMNRTAQTAKNCTDCHQTYKFASNQNNSNKNYYILSYTDALHRLCVSCHTIEASQIKDKSNLAQCSTCHKTELPENLMAGLNWKVNLPHFNSVILPDVKQEKNLK